MPFVSFDDPTLWSKIYNKFDPGFFYFFVLCMKSILTILDVFLDLAFGFTIQYGSREERNSAKEYEKSAQISKVLGRGASSIFMITARKNYLLKHQSYVHPNYILGRDNITLMGVNKEEAIFCVTDDPR